MKTFRPQLQAVLTVRARAEQVAQEQYAKALDGLRQANEHLDQLRREEGEWQREWAQCVRAGSTAGTLVQLQAGGRNVAGRRERAQNLVDEARAASQEALQTLLHARREREAVERHLRRQRQRFHRELSRAEQNQLDELGQRRVAGSVHGGGFIQAYD